MYATVRAIFDFSKNSHRGVAQFGRAIASGAIGRVFESPHSDQKRLKINDF